MIKTSLVAFVLAAIPVAAHADCMIIEPVDALATPTGATIPTDGGVVVVRSYDRDERNKKPAPAKDWKAVDGSGKAVEITLEDVAPGLQRIVRKTAAKAGDKLVIKDGSKELGSYTYGDVKVPLKAPSASTGKVETFTQYRGVSTSFSVDVDAIPDEATFAVVLEHGKPIASVSVPHDKTGKTTIVPYSSGGHCGGSSPGNPPSGAFTLEWADKFGRVGPASKSVPLKK